MNRIINMLNNRTLIAVVTGLFVIGLASRIARRV